jgi:transcription termination factor Rho
MDVVDNGTKEQEVFIVQGDIKHTYQDPEKEAILKSEAELHRPTVVLNNLDKFRSHVFEMSLPMYISRVLENMPKFEISEERVRHLGLRFGDKAKIRRNGTELEILEVNGTSNWESLRNRPHISGVARIKKHYPFVRFPVEWYSYNLLCWGLWSPLGRGQRLFVVSPPRGGKSYVIWDLEAAYLDMTNDYDNTFVMLVQVGERGEDAGMMEQIKDAVPHDPSRVEFYEIPDEDPEHAYYYIPLILVERARRLTEMGFHVVFIIDSASRIFLGHSRSSLIPKKSEAMIAKGGKVESLGKIKHEILSVAGDYTQVDDQGNVTFEGSLTLIAGLIGNDPKSVSSELALYDDTGPSTSTAIWGIKPSGLAEYPMIDMDLTFTRNWERLCDRKQLAQRKTLEMIVKAPNPREGRYGSYEVPPEGWEQLLRLQEYAKKNTLEKKPVIEDTAHALQRIEEMGYDVVFGWNHFKSN